MKQKIRARRAAERSQFPAKTERRTRDDDIELAEGKIGPKERERERESAAIVKIDRADEWAEIRSKDESVPACV